MRFYKSACEFDETRVQNDYSVIGSEFCDFLSTVLTFRLIKAFDKASLLETRTYKKIFSVLFQAKKARIDNGTWQLIHMNPSHLEILQSHDLIPWPEESPKMKRGRPACKQSRENNQDATDSAPKRRGRPLGSKNKPKVINPETSESGEQKHQT